MRVQPGHLFGRRQVARGDKQLLQSFVPSRHIGRLILQSRAEPSARHPPIVQHRPFTDVQHVRDFLDTQPPEETHFDDPLLPWCQFAQFPERVFKIDNLDKGLAGTGFQASQGRLMPVSAPFFGSFTAGVIDKQLACRFCRNGEKMGSALPLNIRFLDKFHEDIVDQNGWLNQVIPRVMGRKDAFGDAVQLAVDHGKQPMHGVGVVAKFAQDSRHVV